MLMTTGVVTVSHYCMDRLASVSLFASTNKKCDKCGMDKAKHGCCTDKESFVKIHSDQNKVSFSSFELLALEKTPILTSDFLLTSLWNGNNQLRFITHDPPLPDNPLYLENNVFRI